VERFNLKKLKNVEVRDQYQVKISKGFAALKNLYYDDDDDVHINRAWESIRI
jgi:hypothetical protein